MASVPGSCSRPHGPLPGDWASCAVSTTRLAKIEAQGYIPPSNFTSTRVRLTSANGVAYAENFLTPRRDERVCFMPFLLRCLGFPIHPSLRGSLEFYGIQLHHLTPGSILYVAGYVALCEMFLGCEAHFELWRKYFCLIPQTRGEGLREVRGAEVCRIVGPLYLVETPEKDADVGSSEWFYIDDVALFEPVRRGLPEFSSAPPKKRYN